MSTHKHIAKSAGTIGGLTALSRVLGFVRDVVIAAAFGTGLAAEAFVVSFRIPNLLRDLVGEGAANSAFVPVLTERREKDPARFWNLVSAIGLALGVVLAVLSVLGTLFAGQVAALIAPGFTADPEKFSLTVRLLRTMFPYIFLIGLSALAMGVLNSLKEFTSSALGPALLNICMIAAGYFFEPRYGPMALVGGVLAGGVLQLACQVPPLVKKGFRPARPDWGDGAVKKIFKLLAPRALGSALYQVNVLVDSVLASFPSLVGAGGQSALYYSNRLFQLPLAIFGVSLGQAVLPTFSTQIVRGDVKGMKETLSLSVRSLAFFTLPAAVGLAVWCRPIVRIVFEHGRFDAVSTGVTSSALFFYTFGLFFSCLIKIFVNAFYAMQDTRTPVKVMALSVAANVLFCLAFMRPLAIGGLALAASLSAMVNMGFLYARLRRKIGALDERAIVGSLAKMLAASALMGACAVVYGHRFLGPDIGSRPLQAAFLFTGIVLGIGLYAVFCLALGVEEIKKVWSWRREFFRRS